MAETLKPELCIIGGGTAGLAVAAAAAALGRPVVLVEKARMGGSRLNTGDVPSKTLIALARNANLLRRSAALTGAAPPPDMDFNQVADRIQRVVRSIEPNDSRERFTALGVRVIEGEARFRDRQTIVVGPEPNIAFEIRARRFVIATGSHPLVPLIPGLYDVPYLTEDDLPGMRTRPKRLIVLGAGPAGMELAQAFRRLGSEVTVVDAGQPLGGEDRECADVVLDAFAREGIEVRGGVAVERVRRADDGIELMLAGAGGQSLRCTDLLIAAGRRPNVKDLGLEAAGIDHDTEGILINEHFATSNSSVSAIGDVTPLPRSTSAAVHQAGLLIRHMLHGAAGGLDLHQLPRVVFTDPELAHVGLTELEARGRGHGIGVLRWPYRDNDRAQAEGEIYGHIKVVTDAKGTVLGATLAGAAASEQISAWTLAVRGRLNIRAFAEIAVPYPSYSEIGKRAATTFFTPRLKTSWVRRLLNGLRGFG